MLELKQTLKHRKNGAQIKQVWLSPSSTSGQSTLLASLGVLSPSHTTPGSGPRLTFAAAEVWNAQPGCWDVATAEQVKSTCGAVRQRTESTPITSPPLHQELVQLARCGSARESCRAM